jgi:hypothetical protein
VTAVRVLDGNEISENLFSMFRQSNFGEGLVLAEVRPQTSRMPSVALLPKMNERGYLSWAWYFSTSRLSPISATIQGLEDGARLAAQEIGIPFNRI